MADMFTKYGVRDENNPVLIPDENSHVRAKRFVPRGIIKDHYRQADRLSNQKWAPSWAGVLAAGLGGIGGNVYRGAARDGLRGNQEMTLDAMDSAGNASSNSMMAKMLLGSDVPDLAEKGLDLRLRDSGSELETEKTRAEIDKIKAQTKYYGNRQSGRGGSSMTERVIGKLMNLDPALSYEEALTIAKRGGDRDSMQRERLAISALLAGEFDNLSQARRQYGLDGPNPNAANQQQPAQVGSQPRARGSSLVPPTATQQTAPMAQPAAPITQPASNIAEQSLANARAAIAQGMPREAVIQRLRDNGIDPAGL